MTNSFGITPQRQLRDTFVKPEQKDRAQPASPEMTPQRRGGQLLDCLLYTSPSPRDVEESRMPSSA